jgi:hypothetical protein
MTFLHLSRLFYVHHQYAKIIVIFYCLQSGKDEKCFFIVAAFFRKKNLNAFSAKEETKRFTKQFTFEHEWWGGWLW